MADSPSPSSSDEDNNRSSLKIEISLAIGYVRHRGSWEGRTTTVVLAIIGLVVVLWFLFWVINIRVPFL